MQRIEKLNLHESVELRKKGNHKSLKLFFFKVSQLRSDLYFLLDFESCWKGVHTLIFTKIEFFFKIEDYFLRQIALVPGTLKRSKM